MFYVRYFLAISVLLLASSPSRGQDRPPTVFFDDFVGDPAGDYQANLGPDTFVRSNGLLTLSVPDQEVLNAVGLSSLVLDAPVQSITTQARYEGQVDGGIGVLLRAGGAGSVGGGILGGNLVLFRDDRGEAPFQILAAEPTDLDVTQDTMFQLDVTEILVGESEGNRIELWAWQGDAKPIVPLMVDDPNRLSPPEGWPGFVVNGGGLAATGTFSFMDVAAIPEPTSCLLVICGATLCLLLRRRRYPVG